MASSASSKNSKLKEVAVVKNTFKKPAPRTKQPTASSSVSSIDEDMTSDYDTPGTSVAVTPAEVSLSKSTSSRPTGKGVSATARALELRSSAQGLSARSTSRKRRAQEIAADDFPDVDVDALLARRLQAEEYEEAASIEVGPSKRKRTARTSTRRTPLKEVDSSSISESSLVEIDSDGEEDIPLASVRRGGRLSLPTRAARDSAKKAIKKKFSGQVPDSEDESLSDAIDDYDIDSELSDQFEMESEAEEGSDTSMNSDNVPPATVAAVATVATAPRPHPRSRLAHRKRRGNKVDRHLSRVSSMSAYCTCHSARLTLS